MISRYTRPEMGALWSDESKFRTWLDVEIAVCEAQAELGLIPKEVVPDIVAKAKFDVKRILEIEEEVKHDVIAFLTNVAENVGENSRYVHLGMTSSDVIDTALALQLRRASLILEQDLEALHAAILEQARKHKHTVMVGRSHGIHAEPITFGFKLAVWLEEVRRHQKRLAEATDMISVGQVSGAVGTYSNISPDVEVLLCEKLGLTPDPVSTQIIQRDRHAQFVFTLALIGTSLDKFATEIRHLQRTDVLEVEEPFSKGQKGSSAMPHKRNPVASENMSGLARILRGNALVALENIPLWHERDISHSSAERVILPDSTILLDYMLPLHSGDQRPGGLPRQHARQHGHLWRRDFLAGGAAQSGRQRRHEPRRCLHPGAAQCARRLEHQRRQLQGESARRCRGHEASRSRRCRTMFQSGCLSA
ncbi:MAG: adenylosuccinate lyase [Candidatus Obscuribacterales bacterium]